MINMTTEFKPHGYYVVSNTACILVEISPEGDAARLKIEDEITDWFEIEFEFKRGWSEPQAIIDPTGYNISLSLVMKI